jgi:hypothetical protein
MYVEKAGTVKIAAAKGSAFTKPQELQCSAVTNSRIARVDETVAYENRYGLSGTAKTAIAEDLDVPGHTHRLTLYGDNIKKFEDLFQLGAIVEAKGLRTRNFGFNVLELKVIQAAPAAPVTPVPASQEPEPTEQAAA